MSAQANKRFAEDRISNPGSKRQKFTMKPTLESVREELAALAGKTDQDIDYSDIPATKDEDWVGAVRGKFYRPATHFKQKEDRHGASELA